MNKKAKVGIDIQYDSKMYPYLISTCRFLKPTKRSPHYISKRLKTLNFSIGIIMDGLFACLLLKEVGTLSPICSFTLHN